MTDDAEKSQDIVFENDEIEPTSEPPQEELAKIISYNVANTVEVLKLKVDNDEINLKPEFQRDFVWDINRASLFIDSLLIGLPIPSIFLGKSKEDEKYIVIDGQQRLKSVIFYINGEFQSNNTRSIFALRNLKSRKWNNLTYAELDPTLARRIKNAVLNTTVIEDISLRPKVVHDIFYRLNTGGMPLTDQEVRNAVYSGVFNQQINDLNKIDPWRKLLGKAVPDRRLRDAELVLRFLALLNDRSQYDAPMREFLSNYQEANMANTKFLDSNAQVFETTVNTIYSGIGEHAFRISSSNAVNKSVCDSVMVAVAELLKGGSKLADMDSRFAKLIVDEHYVKAVTSATSREDNVNARIDLARNYFLGVR